jgi:hypothetical protein
MSTEPSNTGDNIDRTDLGATNDFSEQCKKAESLIRFNPEFLSNISILIDARSKHDLPTALTELGNWSNFNEHHSKHDSSIRSNSDSVSNVTCPISAGFSLSPAKHHFPRNLTDRGMQIDPIEQPRKHDSSIRTNLESDSNSIFSSRA